MRRFLLFIILLCPSLGLTQTYHYPAEETNNVFTGTNLFTLGLSTGPTFFINLPSPPPLGDGTELFCADCTLPSNPCAGGGTGAIALYLNGAWNCNSGALGSVGSTSLLTQGVPNLDQTVLDLFDSQSGGGGSNVIYVHPVNLSGGKVNFDLVLPGTTGTLFYENSGGNLTPMSSASWNDTTGVLTVLGLTASSTNSGFSYAISGNQSITSNLSAGVYGGEFSVNYSGSLGPVAPGDAGLRGDATVQSSATGSGGTFAGLLGTASNDSAGSVTGLFGVRGFAGLNPLSPLAGSSVAAQSGGYFESHMRSLSIALNTGVYAQLTNTICSTCVGTTNAALYADSPSGVIGTFTHNYGLYVADQTVFAGTHNPDPHGIYVAGGGIQNKPVTYATLIAAQPCGAAFDGASNAVSDSSTSAPGGIISGGGTNHVSAYCNGTNWVVGGSGTVSATGGGNPILENCTPDQTGNSFYNVTALTQYFNAAWQFVFNTTTYINCQVYIPVAQTGATLVLDVASSDNTVGHTANFQTCDAVVTTGTLNPAGALTCAANQTFTTTSTAYSRTTLTFNVQSTLSNGSILLVKIGTSPTGTAPTANLLVYPHFVL